MQRPEKFLNFPFTVFRQNVLPAIHIPQFDVKLNDALGFGLAPKVDQPCKLGRIVCHHLGPSPDFDPGLRRIIHQEHKGLIVVS